jgi:hypothetical protein
MFRCIDRKRESELICVDSFHGPPELDEIPGRQGVGRDMESDRFHHRQRAQPGLAGSRQPRRGERFVVRDLRHDADLGEVRRDRLDRLEDARDRGARVTGEQGDAAFERPLDQEFVAGQADDAAPREETGVDPALRAWLGGG